MRMEIGNSTLYHGDCLEIIPDLPPVDMVLTDPPYSSGGLMRSDRAKSSGSKYVQSIKYQNFSGDNRDQRSMLYWCAWWISQLAKKMTDGGAMLCFIDWRNLPLMIDAVQVGGLVYRGIVPWNKGTSRPNKGHFRAQCEYIVYATKGAVKSAAILDGFFYCPVEQNKVHPTQKPLELIKNILKIYPGGSVLDPFMGSGTTGVAAIQSGRKFIGIEQTEYYFEIACQRIAEESREIPLLDMGKDAVTDPAMASLY